MIFKRTNKFLSQRKTMWGQASPINYCVEPKNKIAIHCNNKEEWDEVGRLYCEIGGVFCGLEKKFTLDYEEFKRKRVSDGNKDFEEMCLSTCSGGDGIPRTAWCSKRYFKDDGYRVISAEKLINANANYIYSPKYCFENKIVVFCANEKEYNEVGKAFAEKNVFWGNESIWESRWHEQHTVHGEYQNICLTCDYEGEGEYVLMYCSESYYAGMGYKIISAQNFLGKTKI